MRENKMSKKMKKLTNNQNIKIDLFNPSAVKKPIELPENVTHINFFYDTAERYSAVLIQNIYSLLSDLIGAEKLREFIRFNSEKFDRYLEITTGGKHD